MLYNLIIFYPNTIIFMENSIFVKNSAEDNDISGKLTYTMILESIPETKTKEKLDNWKKKYKTEWRWRFLTFNNKKVVEISYSDHRDKRYYCDKTGNWVLYNVSDIYDPYVTEIYYVYT